MQIAWLSSLGKLCSLLCIIHYKIMYKDINNVTINFGSRHAGFPLDFLSFLIQSQFLLNAPPYIYIFPQTTYYPTSLKKTTEVVRGITSCPPTYKRIYNLPTLTPSFQTQMPIWGWLHILPFLLPFLILPGHSCFFISYFLASPNLQIFSTNSSSQPPKPVNFIFQQ